MENFNESFDSFMKSIDKSKNKLELITDKNGHVKKVWKHIESGESKDAGKNAGKAYERSGKRHTSHSGFESGEAVSFSANGKTIKGVFRHVNESKHSTVAVIRGEDGKLYERGIKKIMKYVEVKPPIKTESKEEKLIEPLRNKKKIGIGNNESVSFLDKSKQSWNKGDSVTFESKNGQQKVGRVLKVDDNINMTTIRLANGMVETVSNKKIIN